MAKVGDFAGDSDRSEFAVHSFIWQLTMQATCIENIDIGGPAMIRASAKNNAAVPGSYLATVKEHMLFVSLTTCDFQGDPQILKLTFTSFRPG